MLLQRLFCLPFPVPGSNDAQSAYNASTKLSWKEKPKWTSIIRLSEPSAWLASLLAQLPVQTAVRIQELRLRTGCAVTFTVQGRQCSASALRAASKAGCNKAECAANRRDISHLCNGSVHTHERELAEGYLTTAVGNRVGVAGQFVQREGQCIALQKVTSLNLRIARSCVIPLPPALDKLLEQHFTGLLVVGEPAAARPPVAHYRRTLAERQRLVAVIDERGELFRRKGRFRRWSALAGWIKPAPSRWRCVRWHHR